MVFAPRACEQGCQGKYPRVGCAFKRQRREAVLSPTQAAQYVPDIRLHCFERRIQGAASHRVVDNVETFPRRMLLDIVIYALCLVPARAGSMPRPPIWIDTVSHASPMN